MSLLKNSFFSMVAISVIATGANADEDYQAYIGLDLAGHQTNNMEDYEFATVGVRAGVDVHEHFGIEARAGMGIVGDDTTVSGINVDVDLNHYLAAYAKLQTKEVNGFRAYGLAGVSYTEIEASALGTSVTGDDTSFSWGLGLSYAFNKNWSANLEYITLNEDADIKSLNLGVTYHF